MERGRKESNPGGNKYRRREENKAQEGGTNSYRESR
jgi:hypothetical protein